MIQRLARRFRRAGRRHGRRSVDVGARHSELSVISTAHDLEPPPSIELIRLGLEAVSRAVSADTTPIEERCKTKDDLTWTRTWPGEHYRLLMGLCAAAPPQLAIEVGTFTGLGSLALAQGAAKVVTFDVVPWSDFPTTALRESDFSSGQIEQRLADLSQPAVFDAHRDVLSEASLIFIDGPKDGRFEERLCELLVPVVRETGALLVFDDIRVMPMIRFWRELPLPKLDLTSFGHWSGTGLAGQIQESRSKPIM